MGRGARIDVQRALVGQRRWTPPPCDARRARAGAAQPVHLRGDLGATEQLLDRVLGRDGVHGQTGSELEAGDLAQPRVDLPVPVVRRVDLLAQRGGVQDEVVGRPIEARSEPAEDLAERLRVARDVGRVGPPEVGLVAAGHDPDLERRARGVRGEGHAVGVLPDEPIRPPRLLADEPAERALPFADDEARRPAELLGDPVRDLGQVVQVEAQVVGPRAGLDAPVLDDLTRYSVWPRRARLDERVAGADRRAPR